jgi:hypothetical protein
MCNPRSTGVLVRKAPSNGLLDNESFQVFNNLASGAPLWAGTRQLAACFAQPERTITDCLHTLLPIEVKPTSVIPEGTDLLVEIKSTLETLCNAVKTEDRRWIKLSLEYRQKWEDIVRSSPASKNFIQAYGRQHTKDRIQCKQLQILTAIALLCFSFCNVLMFFIAYSCANKTRNYTILTNGIDWWFIKRSKQSMGDVQLILSINIKSANPTVAHSLNYIAKQT